MTTTDERRQAALAARAKAAGIPEWQQEMAEAVGTDLIRDIIRDNLRPTHSLPSKASMTPPTKQTAEPQRKGTGWVEPSTSRPSGDWAFNQMMDAQDAKDRAELERKLAQPNPNPTLRRL